MPRLSTNRKKINKRQTTRTVELQVAKAGHHYHTISVAQVRGHRLHRLQVKYSAPVAFFCSQKYFKDVDVGMCEVFVFHIADT